MPVVLDPSQPAIERGIRLIGIGKKAKNNLPKDLLEEIVHDLKSGDVHPASKGAFFGAFIAQEYVEERSVLVSAFDNFSVFDNSELLAKELFVHAPQWIQNICARLINKETLSIQEAEKVGDYLLSKDSCLVVCGFVASLLRVRYETSDEYEGLLSALNKTVSSVKVDHGQKFSVQMAEPFDGVDKSFIVSPLISRYLVNQGYFPVTLIGRNPGPKFNYNLRDVINGLEKDFASSCGIYIDLASISKAMDRWVDIRHKTIKRPFMSTLEKFINPAGVDVIVTSAFHPNYAEKMDEIARRAGYEGSVVIRGGQEGGLGFSLNRKIRLLCSAKQSDGSYRTEELLFDPNEYLSRRDIFDETQNQLLLENNISLIKSFQKKGSTENNLFDFRVKASCAGIHQALEWIQLNQSN